MNGRRQSALHALQSDAADSFAGLAALDFVFGGLGRNRPANCAVARSCFGGGR
jgi:hypothetical protein